MISGVPYTHNDASSSILNYYLSDTTIGFLYYFITHDGNTIVIHYVQNFVLFFSILPSKKVVLKCFFKFISLLNYVGKWMVKIIYFLMTNILYFWYFTTFLIFIMIFMYYKILPVMIEKN